jgi:hypothetical protein
MKVGKPLLILAVVFTVICGGIWMLTGIAGNMAGLAGNRTQASSSASNPVNVAYSDADFRAWPRNVGIDDLVKNPARYTGQRMYFIGETFNVRERGSKTTFQMWVKSGERREVVYVEWNGTASWLREGIMAHVYGVGAGEISGENAFGGTVSQPALIAVKVD